MGLSYSRASERAGGNRPSGNGAATASRRWEFFGLLISTVVIVTGLYLVYQAKTGETARTPFAQVEAQFKANDLLDLTTMKKADDLLPLLTMFREPAEQKLVARKVFAFARQQGAKLQNIGALANITIESKSDSAKASQPDEDFAIDPRCHTEEKIVRRALAKKAEQESEQLDENDGEDEDDQEAQPAATVAKNAPPTTAAAAPKKTRLLTREQLSLLKPLLIVRRPEQFRSTFRLWAAAVLLAFFLIHFFWRWRGFTGDQLILPVIQLLSGLGLMMMVSLRDPLRDQLGFKDFAWGILVGALILPISSQLDYRRLLGGWGGRLALLAAFGLSLALISPLGKGPGTSDAKVNLFGTQPAEAIKILVVMFLAGYLADNWEFLRELNQKPTGVFAWFRRVKIPRLMYFLPVVIAMGIALVLFFKQKDLGPALVLALTFLSLYAIARNGAWLVAGGLAILAGGGVFAYQMMWPQTVYQRLRIAFSPWENGLRGGDQIAHSLWAFSTGEVTGTGLGLGDASIIPAGHTDLIISSLAEELGFAGVLMVVALYALLIARGIRAALRAENEYSFFFALGLTLITAWQILLISCGILGLFPLSGVVSPFLSYGSSSMLANFFIFGAILAISTQQRVQTHEQPFRQPVKWLAVVLGALAVIVIGRAAAVQLFSADDTLIKGVLTKQGDGFYRYSYNPRVIRARRLLPMGTIYDRNQLPLATSKWDELKKEENASRYSALGINVDETCSQSEARHYPFGGRMYYLIGGARTRDEVGAAQFGVEREYENVLRGFDDRAVLVKRTVTVPDPKTKELKTEQIETVLYDYRDLIPLVRHRYFLQHPRVRQLLEKKRDLQLAIDAALQLRVSDFVKAKVTEAHKQTGQSEKGSAVVMNPQNGNLLAVVSYPWPDDAPAGFKRPANAKDRKNQDSPDDEVASKIKVKKMVHDRCFIDRARGGRDAPGSTFKLVTAVAALSKDPGLHETTHHCASLKGESRVGVSMDYRGAKVIIRDDAKDSAHGNPAMSCGIQKSCNAYFAQLGVWDVGAKTLFETADKFGIKMARKNTAAELEKYLPQSAYGQGQIATDSFHLTLVSATIAAGGVMPGGRLVDDDNDQRTPKHERLLRADLASKIGEDMRRVIDHGTGQSLKSVSPSIAGKTGTAETGERTRSHSWFTGFAPYGGSQQIAFTVFIANSGYGGTYAAPVAKEIVEAAARLGLITQGSRTGVSNACSPSN